VLSPLHHTRLWLGFFERLMPRSPSGRSESVLAAGHVEPLQPSRTCRPCRWVWAMSASRSQSAPRTGEDEWISGAR
jgi:hypothetical protein